MMRYLSKQTWMQFLFAACLSLHGLLVNAQEKKSIPAQPGTSNEASVNITNVQILGGLPGGGVARSNRGGNQRVAVQWAASIPAGITLEGFDVVVTASLSNGQSLNQRQSFGSNIRRAEFNFNLPGGNAGNANPNNRPDDVKEELPKGGANPGGFDCNKCGSASLSKGEFELCRTICANNAPPANNPPAKLDCNTKCSRLGGAKKQACLDECLKSAPLAPEVKSGVKKNFLSQNFAGSSRFVTSFAPQIQAQIKEPSPKGNVEPAQVFLTSATANVTARFSRRAEVSALRDFVPPAANPTGELAFGNRNQSNGLQITRLIEILKLPQKAKECPAGHDCFDLFAEARGGNANGQFLVSLEAVYPNNQRVVAASLNVNTLARPVRINVKRSGTAAFVLVTPSLRGAATEAFARTDTETSKNQGLEILEKKQ